MNWKLDFNAKTKEGAIAFLKKQGNQLPCGLMLVLEDAINALPDIGPDGAVSVHTAGAVGQSSILDVVVKKIRIEPEPT